MDEDQVESMRRLGEVHLRVRYGGTPHLSVIERLTSEHLVLRCSVLGGAAGTPTSVILKHLPPDQAVAAHRPLAAQRFANECASLRFLADLTGGVTVAPRLYVGDLGAMLMLIEDLGAALTLQDALFGSDADAEEALVRFGDHLGQMHAATCGREVEFASSQSALSTRSPLCDANLDLRSVSTVLLECLDALDIVPAPAFFDAVSAVEAAVHDPASPWRVLVHGDLGPHNVLLRSEGLVFLDFEFAHFGHGLVDAVGARLAFPQAFHGRCSHARAIRRLERAYRERLVTAVPEAGDDALFTTAIVQACAHWALSKLYGLWVVYLRERLAQGEAYDRQDGRTPERVVAFLGKVVAYIRAFLTTAEDAGQGSAVSTSLQQVVVALLTRWPSIAPLPMYPALESLGEP